MPLRVLDGNQTATTLSSVVTGGEHIVAHTVVSLGSTAISNITSAVSGSVVSISNFPSTQTIAGTVTANVFGQDENNVAQPLPLIETDGIENVERELAVSSIIVDNNGNSIFNNATGPLGLPIAARRLGNSAAIDYITAENNRLDTNVKNSVTIGSLPAISGTVTANVGNYSSAVTNGYKISGVVSSVTAMPVVFPENGNYGTIQGYNGTVGYLNVGLESVGGNTLRSGGTLPISGTVTVGNSVTIGSLPAISGTVTVGAMPNGSLTTRFGTPTTANTAFATSAVTNASRKYLLIQNVTTGSNVITVGIGFTPTATQGIQLTAGAGITFESSYIPTGAVYILSSVTQSNFTVLEA